MIFDVYIEKISMIVCQLILVQSMLENMNDSDELSEETIDLTQRQDYKEFKLPKIQRLPVRGAPKEIKSSMKLPTLRNQSSVCHELSERNVSRDEDIVGQVEKRVRMVMEKQHILQLQEGEESQQDNFEKRINENKEIIKQTKRRNQMKKENQQHNNFMKNNPCFARKISHQPKNIISEKKIKDYKEGDQENGSAHKKKEGIRSKKDLLLKDYDKPVKSLLKQSTSHNKELMLRVVKSKQEVIPLNKIIPTVPKPNSNAGEARRMKKQMSQKSLCQQNKNQLLFDVIHNYLDNPKKHEMDLPQSMKLIRDKCELKEKLKEYEVKLSQNKSVCDKLNFPQKESIQRVDDQTEKQANRETTSKWRKIQVNQNGSISKEPTSFDKQIDRINKYLLRNQQSIQKYVQNQKMLLDMQLVNRRQSKERCLTKEKQNSI